jgi:hypothetical protein
MEGVLGVCAVKRPRCDGGSDSSRHRGPNKLGHLGKSTAAAVQDERRGLVVTLQPAERVDAYADHRPDGVGDLGTRVVEVVPCVASCPCCLDMAYPPAFSHGRARPNIGPQAAY